MLTGLLDSIYDSAFDDQAWTRTVGTLESMFNAHSSALVVVSPSRTLLQQTSVDESVTSAYNLHHWKNDIWMQRFERARSGTVVTGYMLAPLDQIDPDYKADILDASGTVDSLASQIIQSPRHIACFSLYRSPSIGFFSPEDVMRMETITPHMCRAMRLRERLGNLSDHMTLLESAFQSLPTACMIMSETGKIRWMNRSAEKVISDQTLLSSRSGDIRALDAPSAQRWRTTLRHCVGTGQSGTCLMRDVRGAFWMVQASVLRNEIRQEVEDQLVEGDAETLVLVVLHPSANLADVQSQALAEAFGLTAREAELAMELAQGLDLRQAAKNLKIKLAAARSHLKAVFSKTGVTRQAALVAMIVGILAAHH